MNSEGNSARYSYEPGRERYSLSKGLIENRSAIGFVLGPPPQPGRQPGTASVSPSRSARHMATFATVDQKTQSPARVPMAGKTASAP